MTVHRPAIHAWREPGAARVFARLLESLVLLTEAEPDESFTEPAVLALGARFSHRFAQRVRQEKRRQRQKTRRQRHLPRLHQLHDAAAPAGGAWPTFEGTTCPCGATLFELVDNDDDQPGLVTLDRWGHVAGFQGHACCDACGTPWRPERERLSIIRDEP